MTTTLIQNPQARAPAWLAVVGVVCSLGLAACGGHHRAAQVASTVNACSLLSNAEVHTFAPALGSGHPGATKIPHVSICQWDDGHHLPGLTLQVTPANPSGVKQELENGFAHMGYDVRSVAGLGDEAAVATQQADAAHGIQAAVALLSVRVGKHELALSPLRVPIAGPAGAKFKRLKELAAKAAAHLRAKGM